VKFLGDCWQPAADGSGRRRARARLRGRRRLGRAASHPGRRL